MEYVVERDAKISPKEIEELLLSVGWNSIQGKYKHAIKGTYSTFSIRDKGKLIAFARVVSDGIVYAFIVDLGIRKEFQHRGLGKKLIRSMIKELREDGIMTAQLTFVSNNRQLNTFYKMVGFNTEKFKAGDIDLNED